MTLLDESKDNFRSVSNNVKLIRVVKDEWNEFQAKLKAASFSAKESGQLQNEI